MKKQKETPSKLSTKKKKRTKNFQIFNLKPCGWFCLLDNLRVK